MLPGIVLSSKQAKRPAINTGLAINMDIVSSTPACPVKCKAEVEFIAVKLLKSFTKSYFHCCGILSRTS